MGACFNNHVALKVSVRITDREDNRHRDYGGAI